MHVSAATAVKATMVATAATRAAIATAARAVTRPSVALRGARREPHAWRVDKAQRESLPCSSGGVRSRTWRCGPAQRGAVPLKGVRSRTWRWPNFQGGDRCAADTEPRSSMRSTRRGASAFNRASAASRLPASSSLVPCPGPDEAFAVHIRAMRPVFSTAALGVCPTTR
jgi:hypothetical protein